MNSVISFLVASMLCIVFLISGALFSESILDDEIKKDKYCELVIMWESDADAGLEPNDRSGHPNYKGVSCAE